MIVRSSYSLCFFETVERLDQWIHYATKNLGSVTTGGAIPGKHEKIYTLSVKILYYVEKEIKLKFQPQKKSTALHSSSLNLISVELPIESARKIPFYFHWLCRLLGRFRNSCKY